MQSKIDCEATYCIYNKNEKCLCSTISINGAGFCDGYTLVHLDPALLESEKEKHLRDIDERESGY